MLRRVKRHQPPTKAMGKEPTGEGMVAQLPPGTWVMIPRTGSNGTIHQLVSPTASKRLANLYDHRRLCERRTAPKVHRKRLPAGALCDVGHSPQTPKAWARSALTHGLGHGTDVVIGCHEGKCWNGKLGSGRVTRCHWRWHVGFGAPLVRGS